MSDTVPEADGPPSADALALSDETARSIAAVMRLAFRPGTRHANEFGTAAADLIRRMAPRDPVEEMLVAQMVLVHTRAVFLAHRADQQKNLKWFTALSAESDRGMLLFRRQLLALADYRRPRRGNPFTAIRHAHIQQSNIDARQQVVHPPHLSAADTADTAATALGDARHVENVPHAAQAAVPPDAGRLHRPPRGRPADPAVAREHRPADHVGQDGQ